MTMIITEFLNLGLKVMMVCFEKNLSQDWHRVLHCLKDMDTRGEGGIALWDFLDFVVSFRTPLFIQMRPFILTKVCRLYGCMHLQFPILFLGWIR